MGVSSRKHIGILVIHGMGNENPYGPLDEFARGLYWHYRSNRGQDSINPPYQMRTDWRQRDCDDPAHLQSSWTQAQIRFERNQDADASLPESITIAEYYWSPATKGKIKDLAVLTWLVRIALEPFRYLNENLQVMSQAAKTSRSPDASGKERRAGEFILTREIFRLLLIYPFLLVSFIAVAAFLHHLPDLAALLVNIPSRGPELWWALTIVVRLLILGSLAGYVLSWLRWLGRRHPHSSNARYGGWQVSAAMAMVVILLLVPAWKAHVLFTPADLPNSASRTTSWSHCLGLWIAQLLFLKQPYVHLTLPLLELALAATIRLFLIDFMGDVAIYTNLNERTGYFNIRAQILQECGHALTTLYTDLDNRVASINRQAEADSLATFGLVIAAHSLGTVIAYDTINDHFNRARIGAPAPAPKQPPLAMDVCSHLSGLMTFGSPLNKVYYFFRDRSAPEALVRSQIVDGLHGFRLLVADAELPGAPLEPVPQPPMLAALEQQFRWINVWAPMDPFCGKLFFYDLPEAMQLKRFYIVPILAHLMYWKDPQMYSFFADQLLS
jgi:hypothetical protein